jgi:hypothetical protein
MYSPVLTEGEISFCVGAYLDTMLSCGGTLPGSPVRAPRRSSNFVQTKVFTVYNSCPLTRMIKYWFIDTYNSERGLPLYQVSLWPSDQCTPRSIISQTLKNLIRTNYSTVQLRSGLVLEPCSRTRSMLDMLCI